MKILCLISQSIAMEMKVIPEILSLCICWLIQKGQKVKKKPTQNILDEERGKKDIVKSVGLGWLFLILKKVHRIWILHVIFSAPYNTSSNYFKLYSYHELTDEFQH